MSDLAIYDMDRTVTRHPTYTPFLLHCAVRRAPWRLLFLPLVLLSMIAYGLRLIDRARLKEINHHLLLGPVVLAGTLLRLISLVAVLARVGRRLGLKIAAVQLANPLAGVDVDKAEDHALAERVLRGEA